jgi:hypothetical protein
MNSFTLGSMNRVGITNWKHVCSERKTAMIAHYHLPYASRIAAAIRTLAFLSLLTFLVSPSVTYAAAPMAVISGLWSGTTGLNRPVSVGIDPTGTHWTSFQLTTVVNFPGCSFEETRTIFGNGAITNNQFSYTGSPLSFAGTFTSATTVTGTYQITNEVTACGTFTQTGTWNATPPKLDIMGNVGLAGVFLNYGTGTGVSDANGNYIIPVDAGWSGTVTPSKPGYLFIPNSRSYTNVLSDQTGQNYIAHPPGTGGPDTTGVFRPSNGVIFLKNKNDTGIADIALNYGLPGDYPVVGDWDGNGTVTIGIYRNGTFYLRNENTNGFAEIVSAFGQAGDQPIAGDWNHDGVDTIGVYRPSNGQFMLSNSNSGGTADATFFLGNVGDVGIAGDWDGDGFDTTGVFRPSNGVIFLKNSNTDGFADIALNYGLPGDKPVTGDWDHNGDDTIGIYRNGTFYLRNENTNGFAEIVFGLGNPGDMPIAGDWDGLP